MKTKIIYSIAMLGVLNIAAFASSDADARLKMLEERINKLEKENAEFKASIKNLQSEELGARLDDVEKVAYSNKLKFGLGMKNMENYFSGKYTNGTKYFNPNLLSTKLMLNMESDIAKNMKFTGRLSMYKNWSNNNGFSGYDATDGRKPTDSSIFVERAYVDWTAIDGDIPLTFTIGRQPSSDGPSHQYKDNTVRKSTYSALAFDGSADGIVTTLNLEKITGIPEAAFRIAYGKGYQNDSASNSLNNLVFATVDSNGNKVPVNPASLSNNPYVGSSFSAKDTTFYGLFLDASIPGIKGSLLQFGAVKANNLNTLGIDIGDAFIYGVMGEFTNLNDTGFDLFAHYGVSKLKSNGNMLPLNAMLGSSYQNMGLLSTSIANTNEKSGNALWVGGRYDLSKVNFYGKIGYEYNKGSKNWFSFTQGSNDITNKLSTRGDAQEVYYIAPINKFAYARFGWQKIHYDYTGSGSPLGEPMKTSDLSQDGILKDLQNLYLQFNLQY